MADRKSHLARKVKNRDNNTCVKCGRSPSTTSGTRAHHIIPLAYDGPDTMGNMATLCTHCDRYVPESALDREWYEEAFDDFISTGVRPEVDLARFGSNIDVPGRQLSNAYSAVVECQRVFDEDTEETDPEYYWITLAVAADYGVFPRATSTND